MLLSKSCQYAIRALVYVTRESYDSDKKIGLQQISKGISAPSHFLAKILQNLARHGMILSFKGPGGGFVATQSTRDSTILDIIQVIEGPMYCDRCLLGLPNCSDTKPCPSHFAYKPVREELKKLFEETTIGRLSDNLNGNKELFSLGV
jgi:Rrf2 family protein